MSVAATARGFARLEPQRRRELARLGGHAAWKRRRSVEVFNAWAKVDASTLARLDALAPALAPAGVTVTRADAARAAVLVGLELLELDLLESKSSNT
jgi:hypothetical protein